MISNGLPKKQGLYDPAEEKDSCGIGFVAQIKGIKSHESYTGDSKYLKTCHTVVRKVQTMLPEMGQVLLIQVPHKFILAKGIKVPEEGKYATGLVFLPQGAKERDAV